MGGVGSSGTGVSSWQSVCSSVVRLRRLVLIPLRVLETSAKAGWKRQGRFCAPLPVACSHMEALRVGVGLYTSLSVPEKLWLVLTWQQKVLWHALSPDQFSSFGLKYLLIMLNWFKMGVPDLSFSYMSVLVYHQEIWFSCSANWMEVCVAGENCLVRVWFSNFASCWT